MKEGVEVTKLEWCRQNAPDALRELSDEDLLKEMSLLYDKYYLHKNKTPDEIISKYDKNSLTEDGQILERLIFGLSRIFGEKMVLKGGFALMHFLPDTSRMTRDIDIDVVGASVVQNRIEELTNMCESMKRLGIIDDYLLDADISKDKSGKVDFYRRGKHKIGIDIGIRDISFGTCRLQLDSLSLRSYTVERMLCDKLCCISSIRIQRRPKDLYDVYIITNSFEFSIEKICELYKMDKDLNPDWSHIYFSEHTMNNIKHAYEKLSISPIYKNKGFIDKPSFEQVWIRATSIISDIVIHTTD